ncbi:MAG: tRNA (N6-isopentenyl adenosine(37)-C2)-methylthiotransferase MiaB [Bdellovibrionaceae bacterium]|nr:tRNA (N6-isopentenyl adenosine(37)-C2)-methylthiotransferase MiaB [Pseudobdellovibrionaceae bacterium]
MTTVPSYLKNKSNLSKNFFISTYGCQMNVNDSERMACLLEMAGWNPSPTVEMSDLILINSCSIREKPVHKVRSEIGRYKQLKQKKPYLKIGVAGCVAQQERSKLLKQIPLLDFVLGTDAIDELPQVLLQLEHGKKIASIKQEPKKPYHVQTLIGKPGISTFVNISKGCDNFCSFCVVPFTRGRERSRPLSQLIKDINSLVQRGVKEVTLLGQNVNSYRSPCGADFAKLLENLAIKTDIQRIRFTTSHPKDFNEELVETMQKYRSKIMDFIHLPVQSGNTNILKKMNRGYSREEYIEKANMILKKMPGSVLSTDLIVGFPGETEEAFEDSLSLLDEVPYESIFSFKYSARPFTKARSFNNQVPEQIKSQRLSKLQKKHEKIAFLLAKKYEKAFLEVLVEKKDKKTGLFMGRSTQNKLVYFKGKNTDIGKIMPIRIDKVNICTFYGEKYDKNYKKEKEMD